MPVAINQQDPRAFNCAGHCKLVVTPASYNIHDINANMLIFRRYQVYQSQSQKKTEVNVDKCGIKLSVKKF